MKLLTSVIVPVYNEEEILLACGNDLGPHLDRVVGRGAWEYIFVNNGSRDASSQLIDSLKSAWPHTQKIELAEANIGEALKQGLISARGRYAYIINVDCWDPIFLAEAWGRRDQYDLIVGSKRLRSDLSHFRLHRRLLSWGLNKVLKVLLGFRGTDTHGQKLLDLERLRPIIQRVVLRRGQFDTELTLRAQFAGLRTTELPVRLKEIRPPRDSISKKLWRNLVDVIRLRKIIAELKEHRRCES